MILPIVIILVLGPAFGGAGVVFVKADADCRKHHKATHVSGALLEVTCVD